MSFSFGQKIPTNLITGHIIDIDNTINRYMKNGIKTIFEVSLYELLEGEKKIIKKVETDDSLGFRFSAIEDGIYSIVAVEGEIIDLSKDLGNRKYSILSDTLFLNNEINNYSIVLNSGNPIKRNEISSINFINQYYVNYILTDGQNKLGVVDSIYNNFKNQDFNNEELSASILLENQFEEYLTPPFSFLVPEIVDSIPPMIQECFVSDSTIDIKFSEPLEPFDPGELFYYNDSDSNKIFFDILSFEPKYAKIIIASDQFFLDSLDIKINKNIIRDLYENFMEQSFLSPSSCIEVEPDELYGLGGISGFIESSNSNQLVVIAYNILSKKSYMTLVDSNNKFFLNMLDPGEYFLQIYENYRIEDQRPYPFYPGSWTPLRTSRKFSKISGPIEVRSNWEIEDIIIKF